MLRVRPLYRRVVTAGDFKLHQRGERFFSSKPPTVDGTRKAAPVSADGGAGSALLLSSTAFFVAVGATAYHAETDNAFATQLEKIPYASDLIRPARNLLQATGLLAKKQQPQQPPADTVPAVAHKAAIEEPEGVEQQQIEVEAAAVEEEMKGEETVAIDVQNDDVVSITAATDDPPQSFVAAVEEAAVPAEPLPTAPVDEVKEAFDSSAVLLPVLNSESTAKAVESSVLQQALKDSAREFIALRRELELTLLKDLHLLDENTLRSRIKQLATDMFERLAWEDLRMQQALRGVQSELTEKFTNCMLQQRAELELEVKKILLEVEKNALSRETGLSRQLDEKYQKQLADAIRAQAEGFKATMQRELDAQQQRLHDDLTGQLHHQVAVLRQAQVDELMQLEPRIADLQTQLSELVNVIDDQAKSVQQTQQSNAFAAAVMALELTLSSGSSSDSDAISKRVDAVSALSQQLPDAALVQLLLQSLPTSVKEQGALPLSELQLRFQVMRSEVRKTALAPAAAPPLLGQLIGTGLAAVSWAPTGFVPGPGTEEALARAAFYAERGELRSCLQELDAVPGYAQVLMADWKQLARDRIAADQAIQVLKATCVLRHTSIS